MKSVIKVSVIMSEYNTDKTYLRTAIQSILDQTFKDFEFIIVDDRGKNDLAKVVKNFNDDRIRIIKNQKNMGLVYSLNKAVRLAKGEYLVRMDTDDIALPDRIEKTYEFMLAHPEYDVVGSCAVEFSGKKDLGILGKPGEKSKKSIMRGDVPVHPAVIMKKESVVSVSNYDNYQRAEDLALWCKLLLNKKRIFVLDDVLLLYRVNKDDYAKRTLKNRKDELKARITFYPKMGANLVDYLYIAKSIIAGIMPVKLVQICRSRFVLHRIEMESTASTYKRNAE